MKAEQPDRCPTCHRLRKRSNEANRRYWLLIHMMSEQIKPTGQQFTPTAWHMWAKSRFLGMDDVKMPNGKTVSYPKSSAELDKAEFAEYMDQVEAWAAERGVYLEDIAA